MTCPKCYGKIDKLTHRCKECGFNISSFNGATHKAVYRARKEGFGDDVLYTTTLPEDIHKKKLLLLCIFLGLFGGHNYYSGHLIKAIYSNLVSVCLIVLSCIQVYANTNWFGANSVGTWLVSIFSLLMGFNLFMFVFDLTNIIRNKFKVAVYKDEFSE